MGVWLCRATPNALEFWDLTTNPARHREIQQKYKKGLEPEQKYQRFESSTALTTSYAKQVTTAGCCRVYIVQRDHVNVGLAELIYCQPDTTTRSCYVHSRPCAAIHFASLASDRATRARASSCASNRVNELLCTQQHAFRS